MTGSGVNRRRFLASTALVAVGAVMAPGSARALRLEEDDVAERLYLSACETRATHDQVVRDLIAQLEGREGHDKAVELVASMACPLCGCSLASTIDALESGRAD